MYLIIGAVVGIICSFIPWAALHVVMKAIALKQNCRLLSNQLKSFTLCQCR